MISGEPSRTARGTGVPTMRREGHVFRLDWGKNGGLVAEVWGSSRKPYCVRVTPVAGPGGGTAFDTSCTCPVGFDCKHAVAALVHGVNMRGKPHAQPGTPDRSKAIYEMPYGEAGKPPAAPPELDHATEQWLRDVEKSSEPPGVYPRGISKRVFYLLSFTPGTRGGKSRRSPSRRARTGA